MSQFLFAPFDSLCDFARNAFLVGAISRKDAKAYLSRKGTLVYDTAGPR